jgi:hypothetical protein
LMIYDFVVFLCLFGGNVVVSGLLAAGWVILIDRAVKVYKRKLLMRPHYFTLGIRERVR